jgi:hypothetical protein
MRIPHICDVNAKVSLSFQLIDPSIDIGNILRRTYNAKEFPILVRDPVIHEDRETVVLRLIPVELNIITLAQINKIIIPAIKMTPAMYNLIKSAIIVIAACFR